MRRNIWLGPCCVIFMYLYLSCVFIQYTTIQGLLKFSHFTRNKMANGWITAAQWTIEKNTGKTHRSYNILNVNSVDIFLRIRPSLERSHALHGLNESYVNVKSWNTEGYTLDLKTRPHLEETQHWRGPDRIKLPLKLTLWNTTKKHFRRYSNIPFPINAWNNQTLWNSNHRRYYLTWNTSR